MKGLSPERMTVCAGILMSAVLTVSLPAFSEEPQHEVQAGESLWTIAGQVLEDSTLWPALYQANRDQIKDPLVVYPGQILRVPAVEPENREAIRQQAGALISK